MGVGIAPSREVVEAFGGSGTPICLEGGQGGNYRAGNIVLKPEDNVEQAKWAGELLSHIEENGFRIARPVRSKSGAWTFDGWVAHEFVEGEHRLWDGPWAEALSASERFSEALAGVEWPSFLDRRSSTFIEADRIAWGVTSASHEFPSPIARTLDRIFASMEPLDLPPQLVHGDFAGNLLFADGLDPAVIDFTPYWHPGGYPTAMTIVDANLWYGAGAELASRARHVPKLEQLMLRGLAFRLAIDGLQLEGERSLVKWDSSQIQWDLDHANPLIDHIERALSGDLSLS